MAFPGYLLLPRMLCLTFYPGPVMACGGHPFWVETADREQPAVEYNRQQPARSGCSQIYKPNEEPIYMSTVMVEVACVGALGGVNEFYKTVGYGGGVSDADVTLAANVNGRLVGAVRLCEEAGVIVLRGMQVDPEFQRKGIGRTLLTHCIPYLNHGTAYCLPYEHLVEFYGQGGFALAPLEMLPEFLARRLAGYVSSGQRTLAMQRVAKPQIE
jgi:GNAT superfamily N-acetyltransferase